MNIFDKVDTLLLTTAEDRIDENFYYLAGISKTKYVSATLIAKRNGRTVLTNRLEHGTFSGKKIKNNANGVSVPSRLNRAMYTD